MTIRKVLFWFHLAAGITAGTVILIMSLTGVLLTYEKQIIAWADRHYLTETVAADVPRLPAATLVSKIQEAAGSAPTTVTFYSTSPVISAAAGGSTWYIDSRTGTVLGKSSQGVRDFFRTVTEWHRYIALAGDNRAMGKAITGASNLVFLAIVTTGMFIWWPRRLSGESLRAALWFRRGLGGKARNWNWHNVFGAWTAIPLFLVVLSATVISYPWATDLVYRITGTEPPAQGGRGGGAGGQGRGNQNAGQTAREPGRGTRSRAGASANQGAQPEIDLSKVDSAIANAEQQTPDWKTIVMRLPNTPAASLSFNIDRGGTGQPQLRSTMTMDRASGAITVERFGDQNLGRRTRSWLRFVHTGEYYGITGQTIAGIASFAGVMLVWTGFSLSLHRFGSWIRRRSRSAQPAEALPEQHPEVDSEADRELVSKGD
jgi:uncharacterized iron-regulated membrane protein